MKSIKLIQIFALIATISLLAVPAQAQESTGSVTGTVWDHEMVALPDMDVYILDSPDIETTTDSGGVFILENVPAGNHTLVLYKSGYERYTIDITITPGNSTSIGDPMVERIGLSDEAMMVIGMMMLILCIVGILVTRKIIMSRRTVIDEIFFMYSDGRLIKHFTRRIKPDMDSDILSSMLVAVQEFVKDSFRGEGGSLDQMNFGKYQILIARGQHIIIAALIEGDDLNTMKQRVKSAVSGVEGKFPDIIENWDGDMDDMADASAFVKHNLIEK